MRTITQAERALLGGAAERYACVGSVGLAISSNVSIVTTLDATTAIGLAQFDLPAGTVFAGGPSGALGNRTLAADRWAIFVLGWNGAKTSAAAAGMPGCPVPGGFASESAAKAYLNTLAISLSLGVYAYYFPTPGGYITRAPSSVPVGYAPCGYVTVKTASGQPWITGTDAFQGGTGGNPASSTTYYNDPTLAGQWATTGINHAVKFEVQNEDGTWIDLSAWVENGTNWGESLNAACWDATILLRRDGTSPTAQSLVPLITSSPWNVDNSGSYAPLVQPGVSMRLTTAVTRKGVAPTTDPGFAIYSDTGIQTTVAANVFANGVPVGALGVNTAWTLGTGVIPSDKWGIYLLVWDGTTTAAWTAGMSGGLTTGGFASEALAEAAIPSLLAEMTAGQVALGYATCLTGSGHSFTTGTDAFEGGTGGTPATTTNYYFTPLYCGWKMGIPGVIDSVAWGASPIQVKCRDLSAWVADATIELQRQYTNAAPALIETIMAQILAADPVMFTPTLYVPVSPAWTVLESTAYQPNNKGILDALQNDWAATIGWLCRYRFDASDNFRLTFYNPGRTSLVPVNDIFGPTEYRDVTDATLSITNIRNSWWGSYFDAAGVPHVVSSPPIADWITNPTGSQAAYGIRFAGVQEAPGSDSLIHDGPTLQALLDAARADTELPYLAHTMATLFAWHLQLGDGLAFLANGDHYDQDQRLAVVEYRHTLQDGEILSVVGCSGVVIGSFSSWLKRVNASRVVSAAVQSAPVGMTGSPSLGINGAASITVNLPPNATSALWLGSTSAFPTAAAVVGAGTLVNAPGSFTVTTTLTFGEEWYITVVPYTGPSATGVVGPAGNFRAGYQSYTGSRITTYSSTIWQYTNYLTASLPWVYASGYFHNIAESTSSAADLSGSFLLAAGTVLSGIALDWYSADVQPHVYILVYRMVNSQWDTVLGSYNVTGITGWNTINIALSETVVAGYTYQVLVEAVSGSASSAARMGLGSLYIDDAPPLPNQTIG